MATSDTNSSTLPEGFDATSDNELDALMEGLILEASDEDDQVANEQADTSEDLDPLDALMSESLEAQAEKQKLKILRDKQRRGGLSSKEQAENDAWLARWELQNIWKPAANVAMYKAMKCECGRKQTIFHQLLQRQVHRHNTTTQRWIDVETQLANLPNEIVVEKWDTPQCTHCAAKHGFDFSTANVTEWKGK